MEDLLKDLERDASELQKADERLSFHRYEKLYKKYVDKGVTEAYFRLAELYISQFEYESAIPLYEELCNRGYQLAYLKLGQIYLHPLYEDFKKAWPLIRKAQELGVADAYGVEGEAYFFGSENLEQDYNKAVIYLSRADGAYYLELLSKCYIRGLGTNKSVELAYEALKNALKNRE